MSDVRPVESPLAWLGADRLLLDDTSRFGLRRRVIARRGEMMDVDAHVQLAEQMARGANISGWLFERDDFFFLWIVWKER